MVSLVLSPRAPPGEKQFGEQLKFSIALATNCVDQSS